ncbi:MAG: hypothetical protein KGH89_03270 [Thaumarchaeota archaeon]|nr:hypothetical protein [Nitrososphaerota archaeon]
MQPSNLDKLRKCCENQKTYLIVYDGGPTPDLPVLVCQSCYDSFPVFQKFIKSKQFVEDSSNQKMPTHSVK